MAPRAHQSPSAPPWRYPSFGDGPPGASGNADPAFEFTAKDAREARECMKQAQAAVGNPTCRLTAEGVLESEWEGDED